MREDPELENNSTKSVGQHVGWVKEIFFWIILVYVYTNTSIYFGCLMSTNISITGLCSPGCEPVGLLRFYSNVRFAAPTQWPGMWPMLQCERQTGDHRPVIALIIWGQVTASRVRAGDTSPIITEYHNSPNDSLLTAKFMFYMCLLFLIITTFYRLFCSSLLSNRMTNECSN